MRNYEKQILEISKEISDEVIMKEKDPSYVPVLDKNSIARSLSVIYEIELRKTTEDLATAVRKELSRRKS